MLVLLESFAAFDTFDHDNLFYILEKYVEICGNALKQILHTFIIVLNVFKLMMFCLIFQILFVVFLRDRFTTFKICFYLLPMSAISEVS